MDFYWVGFFLWMCCLPTVLTRPETVRIVGGIFDKSPETSNAERAFTFAVERFNTQHYVNDTTLVADAVQVASNDTFDATKTVCQLLSKGVAAIFGPASQDSAMAVGSVCRSMDVPFVETRWEFEARESLVTSINLHPSNRHISLAIKDIVLSYHWTTITIVYEEESALTRLQEVLHASAEPMKVKVTVYRIPSRPDMRELLKEIKRSGARHIIIDCRSQTLPLLLEQIMEMQMLRSYYHYLFTSMDLTLLNMSRYSGDGVNITAVHLHDTESAKFHQVALDWRSQFPEADTHPMEMGLTTEAMLIIDAVHVLAEALTSHLGRNMSLQRLSCFHGHKKSWDYGLSFFNYIKSVTLKNGLTGEVNFSINGGRDNPKIFISELFDTSGLKQRGFWNTSRQVHLKPRDITSVGDLSTYYNRTLIVTTIREQPYVMYRETDKEGVPVTGNDRYYGFCIDMLKKISEILHFSYKIVEVEDNNYGSELESGRWNGMVGELMERKADLAVAPLTITYSREQVIDFSKPYMHLGITILYRSPEPQNPGVFSFLNPLSFDVWLYVVLAFFLVSITLFLLARFSPYEWYNSHPCNPEYDEVRNQFNLTNCLWFSFGGLMQQGSEVNPRAFSTRVLSGFWWFFSLILVSSYTANLAAFLTVERMVSPISSADDLSKQTEIEYGTRSGGSSETFFRRSKIPTYQKMYEFMSARPHVFSKTYDEGIERVLNSKNYAFLLESTTAEYRISQHCKNLTLIGGLLNSRGYGIGTPLGSALRDEITKAILSLQEDETIIRLKQQWWKSANCQNNNANQKEDANELGVKNIGGIFLVLISGLVASAMAAVAEFVWKSRQNATLDSKSLCGEMMAEMRFACRCNKRRNSKPVIEHKYIPTAAYPASGMNGQAIQMAETVA
ncbi:glutamate receptor ionotropic, kainate 1-like [Acanthaster planci]|uniref:Glutamate receptor 1 n=1 Tax=Acanthaster planci TaxID=133434 RepID=A0A8B7ZCV1_ACAPL|nr:glutamate receptor ionotropic, kainate 1-like [Acanthaster planci]XP_022103505.1 glutamate receptor ionotropic, kainate 1-like [Acanthaster planci]